MAYQPTDGDNYYKVTGTAVGTVTIIPEKTTFRTLISGTATTGTVVFYDSASGTTADILFEVTGAANINRALNIRVRNGLTYVTSGTTNMIATWS